MPTVVTNEFKIQEGAGNVDISASNWVASLMNDIVPSADDVLRDFSYWNDVTSAVSAYEASGNGYTSGVTLSNVGWYTTDNDNRQRLSADDISFNNITIQTYGLAVWRTDDNLVIGFVDFGPKTTSNGNLSINWNSGGILVKI